MRTTLLGLPAGAGARDAHLPRRREAVPRAARPLPVLGPPSPNADANLSHAVAGRTRGRAGRGDVTGATDGARAWAQAIPGGIPRTPIGRSPPMRARTAKHLAACLVLLVTGAAATAWADDRTAAGERESATALRSIRHWNQVAIDASGLDHTPRRRDRDFASSSARAARRARWRSCTSRSSTRSTRSRAATRATPTCRARGRGVSLPAAVAQASHDTLVALFPAQTARFDDELARRAAAHPARPREDERHRARTPRRRADPGAARRTTAPTIPSRSSTSTG